MNKHFKSNERELIKVANFFKRQSRQLIAAGKLPEEHRSVEEAVDKFVTEMERHADTRAQILEQREYLRNLVHDQAKCPKCNSSDKLKKAGTEKNEKGWVSNRYRCRKCNITFTWNKPNNPWDLIKYFEELLALVRLKANDQSLTAEEREYYETSVAQVEQNLDRLKPVIAAHDEAYEGLQTRDLEMDKLIHEFRNSLLIEKIKMDTWENKKHA